MATSLRRPAASGTSLQYRRLSLVLNEKAGAMLEAGKTPDPTARLESAGATTRTIPDGKLPDRLRQALEDADAVVVAGGDGTVACAASALQGTGVPLGILPGGTMNLLAKDLHLPITDLDGATDVILDGHTLDIDVGYAGEHIFLCACMMGAPAHMGRHREQARGHRLGWLKIGRAAVRVLARPKSMRLTLTVDGQVHRLRTPSLTISVNPVDDLKGGMFARSRLDAGRLCAYAVRRRSLAGLVRAFVHLALGHSKDPSMLVLEGTTVQVDTATAALCVLVDGEERLLHTPLSFTIKPGALRVFAPTRDTVVSNILAADPA